MKISAELNATRRKNLWNELKDKYPEVHEYGLLQVYLQDLGLSYWKDSQHFYIKKCHFSFDYIESIILRIKGLDLLINVSSNTVTPSLYNLQDNAIITEGYIFTASNVYKPFSLNALSELLLEHCKSNLKE